MLDIIYGNPSLIELDLDSTTETLGIETDEYVNIIFVVKAKKKDSDEDSKLKKTLEDGEIFLDNNKYYIQLEPEDFELLESNKIYIMGVGVTYIGQDDVLELDLDDDRVRILPDTIRE